MQPNVWLHAPALLYFAVHNKSQYWANIALGDVAILYAFVV